MTLLFIAPIMAIPCLWLFWIRPYCIRNGQGYTPGQLSPPPCGVDWQQASEIAAKNGDAGMRRTCHAFLVLQFLVMSFSVIPFFLTGA